jgi:hypothetical protein
MKKARIEEPQLNTTNSVAEAEPDQFGGDGAETCGSGSDGPCFKPYVQLQHRWIIQNVTNLSHSILYRYQFKSKEIMRKNVLKILLTLACFKKLAWY